MTDFRVRKLSYTDPTDPDEVGKLLWCRWRGNQEEAIQLVTEDLGFVPGWAVRDGMLVANIETTEYDIRRVSLEN